MTTPAQTIPGYHPDPDNMGIEEVHARTHADLDRQFPGGWRERYDAGDREVRDYAVRRFEYHLQMPFAVSAHNKAVPFAQQYAQACADAERAIADADRLYADLDKNTTINWLAAHHRFVLAVVRARELLTARVDAATALAESDLAKVGSHSRSIYEAAILTGQRIELPDVDAAKLELAEFVEQTRTRIDVLRATVSGGYPEGFAHAARTKLMSAQAGPVDDDWAAAQPASVAVVAGERAW